MSLVKDGYVPSEYLELNTAQVSANFNSGACAMYFDGPYEAKTLTRPVSEGGASGSLAAKNFSVVGYPKGPNGRFTFVGHCAFDGHVRLHVSTTRAMSRACTSPVLSRAIHPGRPPNGTDKRNRWQKVLSAQPRAAQYASITATASGGEHQLFIKRGHCFCSIFLAVEQFNLPMHKTGKFCWSLD